MSINFDDLNDIKFALKKEEIKSLRIQIKIKQLKTVIKAHENGIYNPKLYDELMKRCK